MGRNPKKAGKKAKAKGGGGGGEKMKDAAADDSDFELEDGVTVVTGETDDEMDEDGSGRCVRSLYHPDTSTHKPVLPAPPSRAHHPREQIGRALMMPLYNLSIP